MFFLSPLLCEKNATGPRAHVATYMYTFYRTYECGKVCIPLLPVWMTTYDAKLHSFLFLPPASAKWELRRKSVTSPGDRSRWSFLQRRGCCCCNNLLHPSIHILFHPPLRRNRVDGVKACYRKKISSTEQEMSSFSSLKANDGTETFSSSYNVHCRCTLLYV